MISIFFIFRFRKKESKCNALLLSEKELKEQLTTCKGEKEEFMLEVETVKNLSKLMMLPKLFQFSFVARNTSKQNFSLAFIRILLEFHLIFFFFF